MSLASVLNDLSEIVFPTRCLACDEILHSRAGRMFCSICEKKINFITGSICNICGTPFPDSPSQNHVCGDCLEKRPYFDCARAIFSYEDIILNSIHQFKYKNNITIGEILASFMADFSFSDINFKDYSLIIPVPLHVQRLRERGFNQSLILARALGEKKKIPVDFSLLKRHKFTVTQKGSNKKERQENVKGVFHITDTDKLNGRNIILVDDVYTTGATVNECVKTLNQAGAERVSVLTLARVLSH